MNRFLQVLEIGFLTGMIFLTFVLSAGLLYAIVVRLIVVVK